MYIVPDFLLAMENSYGRELLHSPGQWNMELLTTLFPNDITQRILPILPPYDQMREDKMVWSGKNLGQCKPMSQQISYSRAQFKTSSRVANIYNAIQTSLVFKGHSLTYFNNKNLFNTLEVLKASKQSTCLDFTPGSS